MKSKHKIWFGVGAFVVAGTAASGVASSVSSGVVAPLAEAAPSGVRADIRPGSPGPAQGNILLAQHSEHDKPGGGEAGEGGEGGEAGSSGIASLPPELAFATRIALLRGHLLVGEELVKQYQWNAALPHFLHPTEELYGDLKDTLADYKVAPFDGALKALADVVKARKSGNDYARAQKLVNDALADADRAMQGRTGDWPGLVTEAAIEALKVAGAEYSAAIVDGRIAKPVEYQDARGFIWQADRMIESVSDVLEKKNAEALASVRTGFAELKKAFPSPMPPRAPIKSSADVLSDIARIELAASKLL
jgi:hypothetical protein